MDNRTRINIQGSTDGFLDRRAFIERGNDSSKLNNNQFKEVNVSEKKQDIVYININTVKNKDGQNPGITIPKQYNPPNNQPSFEPGRQNSINKFSNRFK